MKTRSPFRRIARTAAALAALAFLAACRSLPGTQLARTPQGSVAAAVSGHGRPVVVFEAGAGDDLNVWREVVPEVSKFTTTFAYSRRGHQLGLPASWSMRGSDVVATLRTVLRDRGLAPPYLLVGHSLGGLYMELFAKLHPDEVAGLVLVDPTHPDHAERLKRDRPVASAAVKVALAANALSPLGAELRGAEATGREWHAAGPLPRVPAIVLTATRSRVIDGPDFAKFTADLQRELVAQWPGTEQRFVDATHYIQREKPEAVIDAIRSVASRAQR